MTSPSHQYLGKPAECGSTLCFQALLVFFRDRTRELKETSDWHWKNYTRFIGKKGKELAAEEAISSYQSASHRHLQASMFYRELSNAFEERYPETYAHVDEWRREKFG